VFHHGRPSHGGGAAAGRAAMNAPTSPDRPQDLQTAWPQIAALCRASFRSSLHFAIGSNGADGHPHLTPIGSLLALEPGRALYFDLFAGGLRARLDADPRVCVMAVDSSRWTWLRALWSGHFTHAPALRLYGRAGVRRPATAEEKARFHKRVGWLLKLKAARMMWERLDHVRELHFDTCQPVRIGALTRGL
jgi:hypothetical protein